MLVSDGGQGGEGDAVAGDGGQVGGADLIQQLLLPAVQRGALQGEEGVEQLSRPQR